MHQRDRLMYRGNETLGRRYESLNLQDGSRNQGYESPDRGSEPFNREGPSGIYCNAQMSSRMLKAVCRIDTVGSSLLRTAMNKLNLSARAHDHILKVSRTIADLAGSEEIQPEHLAEAIQYRSLDREKWGT